MGLGVKGFGFRVSGLGFRELRCRVQASSGLKFECPGFRGSGFRVEGIGV
jgi:hypothetical protein